MNKRVLKACACVIVILGVASAPAWAADDAPGGLPPTKITADDLAKTVEGYVKSVTKKSKTFSVRDAIHAEDVEMNLLSVHRDGVHRTGADTFVVCADFELANVEPLLGQR